MPKSRGERTETLLEDPCMQGRRDEGRIEEAGITGQDSKRGSVEGKRGVGKEGLPLSRQCLQLETLNGKTRQKGKQGAAGKTEEMGMKKRGGAWMIRGWLDRRPTEASSQSRKGAEAPEPGEPREFLALDDRTGAGRGSGGERWLLRELLHDKREPP
ncbi:hypothetical protein AOLI_G00268500 [Acnodon oligacanthus]